MAYHDGYWSDYVWLVVAGAIVAFFMAWTIGANDVANSFGTSVGSKTLTLWQACIIAAFCEFGGAIALGGPVAKTMAGGVANPASFEEAPEIFAFGMLISMVSAATWVAFATYLELAVSTTHAIIGSIVGFALVWKGSEAVIWNETQPDFPYRKGIVTIVISWFTSPICAAISGAFLFYFNRLLILRRKNAAKLAFWALPPLVGCTVFINIFFVLYKGAKAELAWTDSKAAWVAGAVTAGAVALCVFVALPVLKWKLKRDMAKQEQDAADAAKAAAEGGEAKVDLSAVEVEVEEPKTFGGIMRKYMKRAQSRLTYSLTVDVHEDVHKDATISAMHANAEVFDAEAETVYQYLQVFSACCMSFAHGANDVANAIGPFAGIWYVYRNWAVSSSADSPKWILALGGAGIVVGLGTYGYNIIKTLGVAMAKMTPSRGYCAELATALTVSVCSVYGLPISTTHCIVGAEVGIGLTENLRTGTNWKLFAKTFTSWIFTILVGALISAALFSLGVFAPSLTASRKTMDYERLLSGQVKANIVRLNSTNWPAGQATPTSASVDAALVALNTDLKAIMDVKKSGFVNETAMEWIVQRSFTLLTDNTVPVIGGAKAVGSPSA